MPSRVKSRVAISSPQGECSVWRLPLEGKLREAMMRCYTGEYKHLIRLTAYTLRFTSLLRCRRALPPLCKGRCHEAALLQVTEGLFARRHLFSSRRRHWVCEYRGFSPFRVEKLAPKVTDEGVSRAIGAYRSIRNIVPARIYRARKGISLTHHLIRLTAYTLRLCFVSAVPSRVRSRVAISSPSRGRHFGLRGEEKRGILFLYPLPLCGRGAMRIAERNGYVSHRGARESRAEL